MTDNTSIELVYVDGKYNTVTVYMGERVLRVIPKNGRTLTEVALKDDSILKALGCKDINFVSTDDMRIHKLTINKLPEAGNMTVVYKKVFGTESKLEFIIDDRSMGEEPLKEGGLLERAFVEKPLLKALGYTLDIDYNASLDFPMLDCVVINMVK